MNGVRPLGVLPVLLLLVLALAGCSTVQASSIATGSLRLPPRSGAISIYAGNAPTGAVELGSVEVRAYGEEGTVDNLLPQFVRRVADLGGNAAVIDGVRARFDIVARPYVETFYYACGIRMMCSGTRSMALNDEMMTVVMSGKAMLTGARAAAAPRQPTPPPAPAPEAPAPEAPAPEGEGE